MLTAIQKVRYYRKHGTSAYIKWIHERDYTSVDLTKNKFNFLMSQPSRKSIDRELFLMLTAPAWVTAAEDVLSEEVEEVEEVIDSPFSVDIDYNSMTIRELQDICRERGLTIRGTKAQVVLRLKRDDEGITEETQPHDETEAPSEEAVEESSDAPAEAAVNEEVNNNDSGQEPNIDEEE